MHIIDDVVSEKWTDRGHPPEDPSEVAEYESFLMSQRPLKEESGYLTYYLKTHQGKPLTARMNDIKEDKDPLRNVRNCYLKLQKDGEMNVITGVMLDREWIERK